MRERDRKEHEEHIHHTISEGSHLNNARTPVLTGDVEKEDVCSALGEACLGTRLRFLSVNKG